MEEHPLSLYELNALVKRSIHACLPDTYWVQAELSDVRSNYSGHCYLEFVQKEPRGNNLILSKGDYLEQCLPFAEALF